MKIENRDEEVLGEGEPGGEPNLLLSNSAENVSKDIQAMIGSRIYETWLLDKVTKLDASSAMRMMAPYLDSATPPVRQLTPPMKLKVPTSLAEDASAQTAEEGTQSSPTSATFDQYSPSVVTFRSQQIVSNELLADAKVLEILSYQMASNIAEQLQAYLLATIGLQVVGTARHHRNPVSGTIGTTDGIPTTLIMTSLLSATPLVAQWTATVNGGIAAETSMFKMSERKNLIIASHPSAATTYVNSITAVNGLNTFVNLRDYGKSDCVTSILGVPWHTDDTMPKPSVQATTSVAVCPHILIFNPQQVLLAVKSPVRVWLDTESGITSNQTKIYATFRAAGSMLNPKSIAAYSLKTLIT